jgi:NAD(P)-dependent dehydrogenase (short-subunit alcohol dehydrogenase family)
MNVLVFGSTGSIGSYIASRFRESGNTVFGVTTKLEKVTSTIVHVDNLTNISYEFDTVVWANGMNFNDSIDSFNPNLFSEIVEGNVSFILQTLRSLLDHKQIKYGAKLVIISSIWEETTRPGKLSYTVTKAALSGLVKSLAYDLSEKNILINNVLPGVVDNEMTRKTLSEESIEFIKTFTNFNRLITLEDIYVTVKFLTTENSGITGQSIKVDLGFTNIKKYK